MKRFLYEAVVTSASGSQVFYIDAETREEADERAERDDTDGIYQHEVEVTDLSSLEYTGQTDTGDFGDFPPAQHPTSAPDSSDTDLLRKYIRHIRNSEGIDFLSNWMADGFFTPAELERLNALSDEAGQQETP